jgi:gas vesicle protein
MLNLQIPDDIEQQLNALAISAQSTASEIVLSLVQDYVKQHKQELNQQHEEEALQIHDQLMDQYAETFQKLAQ